MIHTNLVFTACRSESAPARGLGAGNETNVRRPFPRAFVVGFGNETSPFNITLRVNSGYLDGVGVGASLYVGTRLGV